MRMRAVVGWVVAALACAGAGSGSAWAGDDGALRFECVRVFDGEHVHEGMRVRVRSGRIVSVGRGCDESILGGGTIDGRDRTLLPGLIDAHVHAYGPARGDALRFGVTGLLDMFAMPDGLAQAREERDDLTVAARADLWSAGIMATAPGGHGTQFGIAIPTLTMPEEADDWVRARKAEGSDYIKLAREDFTLYGRGTPGPTLDRATAAAVIAAAHRHGLRAYAHVSRQRHAIESVEDGADGLVHIFHDEPASDAFIELARERGAVVVPTVTVLAGMAGRGTVLLADANMAPWLGPLQRQTLTAKFPGAAGDHLQTVLATVLRLHAAGVPILAGSDAPNPNTAHGATVHEELALLVEAGLTPMQALAAATSVPAKAFGLADRGRIATGARADLLLVEGDPTQDIAATRAIVGVWKNGRELERKPSGTAGAATAAAAPKAPISAGVVSRFDEGRIDSRFGQGWVAASDSMMGGRSESALALVEGGADGSAGALRAYGQVRGDGPQAWAGLNWFPADGFGESTDFRSVQALRFMARGDGRHYQVMLFAAGRMSAMQGFDTGGDWRAVRLPLADFQGIDLSEVNAIAIFANRPEGGFDLYIDSVELE